MFTFGLQTFVCVFSDVLIEIFVLHRYFSQYLSLYEVFNVHKSDTQFYVSDRMEMERFELLTPCLQGRCSPN